MTHTGYGISGRLHAKMDDGTEREFGPGEVSYVPPGHDAWVVGNEPLVAIDFIGMKKYATTSKIHKGYIQQFSLRINLLSSQKNSSG